MLLVLVLAGLFVYLRVEGDLNESLDEGLRARADDVASALSSAPPRALELDGQRVLVDDEDAFAQVLSGGTLVSSTLPESAGPAIDADQASEAASGPRFFDNGVPGVDGPARILARPVADARYVVVVGSATEDRDETLAGLRNAFLIGAPLAILLASVLGYLLAGRAIAPVAAMRRRAEEITLSRGGERLPLPAAADEIRDLGETLNAMLDRIEGSLRREREFVADASHELRTPLAVLRTELELADREGRSTEELRAALRSAQEEADRLSQLAEDLLVLARSDEGALVLKRERVDLGELLERVRRRFARRAERESREIVVAAPATGAAASLDRLRIEQALGNLVENALRHGEGEIRLSAGAEDGRAAFEVSDAGAGFPAEFAPDAFDRFTRPDAGRGGPGAGLGLAIVRAIARAHGGDAELAGAPSSAVRLTIPL